MANVDLTVRALFVKVPLKLLDAQRSIIKQPQIVCQILNFVFFTCLCDDLGLMTVVQLCIYNKFPWYFPASGWISSVYRNLCVVGVGVGVGVVVVRHSKAGSSVLLSRDLQR